MRRRIVAAVLSVLILAGALGLAAHATATDTASTSVLLSAARAALTQEVQHFKRSEAAANAAIRAVSHSCPRALAGYPSHPTAAQRRTGSALYREMGYALVIAEVDIDRATYERVFSALGKLSFSRPSVVGDIARFVRDSRRQLALKPPDLCADARAAAQAKFTVVPSATTRFLRAAAAATPGNELTLADLADAVKPYVTPGDRASFNAVHALQKHLTNISAAFNGPAVTRLLAVLASG